MIWPRGPNPGHQELIRQGVKEWNAWREKNPEVRPDLVYTDFSEASLSEADLTGAYLEGADLTRADLTGAKLMRADLTGAGLQGANLTGANLMRADLTGAYLVRADLKGAKLTRVNLGDAMLRGANLTRVKLGDANLCRATLKHADLTGAGLGGTHLHQVDLRKATGLEEVEHGGPSSVSSKTFELSQGQIPDAFLKGCGFPDWAIESAKLYNPNLRPDEVVDLSYRIVDMRTNSPIAPLSVFISYSNKDMDFIERLEARFDTDGIRSWRDVKDMVAGPIEGQIDRSIRLQKVVLLVISKNSIRSDWVEWEVRKARELQKDLQEKSDKTVHLLCPVAIDKAWWESNPWPERLRAQVQEYNIVDLSEWEDDDVFEAQYEKLRKGLGIFYRNETEGGEGDAE